MAGISPAPHPSLSSVTTDEMQDVFDAVVMFCGMDRDESHDSDDLNFSIGFANQRRVIWIQPTDPASDSERLEQPSGHGVQVLHAGTEFNEAQARRIESTLRSLRVSRPLYWVSDTRFLDFIDSRRAQLTVFHGAEGLVPALGRNIEQLRALLSLTDLAVIAHQAAEGHLRTLVHYDGPVCVLGESERGSSPDQRFSKVAAMISHLTEAKRELHTRRNIVVLYDVRSTMVGTIREHLQAFERYSSNRIYYLPATAPAPDGASPVDLNAFDAVILHYSIRLSRADHLLENIAVALENYHGTKIAFLQDEYENTDTAKAWLKRLRVDVLFSCIPPEHAQSVYPAVEFPDMRIVPTLTGYVPEDASIEVSRRPMEQRALHLAYRGRRLPHHYGALGQEKQDIGRKVRRYALAADIPADIEIDEEHRIYGRAWYEFLANARATLGTESGSNVFDWDGSLAKASSDYPDMTYEDFSRRFLAGREGPVRMNQISPKVFEAIRLHVALILFEGEYSGIIKPDLHFIPLKKDFSNIAEVLAKVDDLDFLNSLTSRAYRDVIAEGRYSYASFIRQVDEAVANSEGMRRSRSLILSVPAVLGSRGALTPLPATKAASITDQALPSGTSVRDFQRLALNTTSAWPRKASNTPGIVLQVSGTAVSERVSRLSSLRQSLFEHRKSGVLVNGLTKLWEGAPPSLKRMVRAVIR